MINLNNIVKEYEAGNEKVVALKEISLRIRKGEFTSIMGPSGSGKSTMMNILGLLDSVDSGSYFLNGLDVSHLNESESAKVRNQEIGFVFQSFNLLPRMSLLDNVALPMVYAGISYRERRRRAFEALDRVGLSSRIEHQPNAVSGGQKQRVAIARALVNKPAVLMADEPTGNLDSKTTQEIMGVFQELNHRGTTIVMVTHEPEVAEFTNRILSFRDGEIIKDQQVENQKIFTEEVLR